MCDFDAQIRRRDPGFESESNAGPRGDASRKTGGTQMQIVKFCPMLDDVWIGCVEQEFTAVHRHTIQIASIYDEVIVFRWIGISLMCAMRYARANGAQRDHENVFS